MIRGLIAGTMGLALLEAVVSTPQAAGNAGTALGFLAGALARWVDPTIPLVPQLAQPAGNSGTAYTTPTGAAPSAEDTAYGPATGITASTLQIRTPIAASA